MFPGLQIDSFFDKRVEVVCQVLVDKYRLVRNLIKGKSYTPALRKLRSYILVEIREDGFGNVFQNIRFFLGPAEQLVCNMDHLINVLSGSQPNATDMGSLLYKLFELVNTTSRANHGRNSCLYKPSRSHPGLQAPAMALKYERWQLKASQKYCASVEEKGVGSLATKS